MDKDCDTGLRIASDNATLYTCVIEEVLEDIIRYIIKFNNRF